MILCKRVTKKCEGRTILENVTLSIDPGESVCITGPGGSGKTTLFRLLLAADKPSGGTIEVDGVPLSSLPPVLLQLYRSRLGIIFQEPRLLKDLTVRDNIACPLELKGTREDLMRSRTDALLRRLDLTEHADQFPEELSTSRRALTGIARAFVASPIIVLADEPLKLLDASSAPAVLDLLREARQHGSTIITFTCDPLIAESLSARVLTLENGRLTAPPKLRMPPAASAHHRILEMQGAPSPISLPPAHLRPRRERRSVRITAIHS